MTGDNTAASVQHIGIVACSAEGAALCYRTICIEGARYLGPHAHPEISIHAPSLADYTRHLDRDDWRGVGELMLASAHTLAGAGADFLICPDNTIHRALPHVEPASPLPWLHIVDVVAEAAVARGFRRLGLTGTRWLVDGDVYLDRLSERGLTCVRPTPEERDEINRIIMDELVCGQFTPEAVAYFQRVFGRMKDDGCEAVILGCTEIPLIMSDDNSPLPTLDSTRLLARAGRSGNSACCVIKGTLPFSNVFYLIINYLNISAFFKKGNVPFIESRRPRARVSAAARRR